jgi:hypothetical protein
MGEDVNYLKLLLFTCYENKSFLNVNFSREKWGEFEIFVTRMA